jgi:hypothetical protein
LWRSVRESPFYFTKERRVATRHEAREDLWLSATHQDEEVSSFGTVIALKRGQVLTSMLALADKWRWNRGRVRSFLDLLERRGEISQSSDSRRTILTICNYPKWNDPQPTNRTANRQSTDTKSTTDRHVQESEESEKAKKQTLAAGGDFDEFWKVWPKKVKKAAARKAWDQLNGNRPQINLVLDAIRWQSKTDQWRKDDGRFIPYPATWINAEQWNDEPTEIAHEPDTWSPITKLKEGPDD